jgi:hypothetical protein
MAQTNFRVSLYAYKSKLLYACIGFNQSTGGRVLEQGLIILHEKFGAINHKQDKSYVNL